MYGEDPTALLVNGYLLGALYAVLAIVGFVYAFSRSKCKGLLLAVSLAGSAWGAASSDSEDFGDIRPRRIYTWMFDSKVHAQLNQAMLSGKDEALIAVRNYLAHEHDCRGHMEAIQFYTKLFKEYSRAWLSMKELMQIYTTIVADADALIFNMARVEHCAGRTLPDIPAVYNFIKGLLDQGDVFMSFGWHDDKYCNAIVKVASLVIARPNDHQCNRALQLFENLFNNGYGLFEARALVKANKVYKWIKDEFLVKLKPYETLKNTDAMLKLEKAVALNDSARFDDALAVVSACLESHNDDDNIVLIVTRILKELVDRGIGIDKAHKFLDADHIDARYKRGIEQSLSWYERKIEEAARIDNAEAE